MAQHFLMVKVYWKVEFGPKNVSNIPLESTTVFWLEVWSSREKTSPENRWSWISISNLYFLAWRAEAKMYTFNLKVFPRTNHSSTKVMFKASMFLCLKFILVRSIGRQLLKLWVISPSPFPPPPKRDFQEFKTDSKTAAIFFEFCFNVCLVSKCAKNWKVYKQIFL